MTRPEQHLAALSSRYPHAWRELERMHLDRGRGLPDWPRWCFVPLAGAYAIVSAGRPITLEQAVDVGRVGALGAWRMTKGLYRLDPDLMDALWTTRVTGEIPSRVLEHLPEWCLYVETPGRECIGQALHGFFVHLEYDANDARRELRLLLDYEGGLVPLPVHLGGSVTEGLERMIHEAEMQAAALGMDLNVLRAHIGDVAERNHQWARTIEALVSVTLYLCSEQPDITGRQPGVSRPQPTRTKRGMRLFAAPGVRVWRVGERLGEALRRAREAPRLQIGERAPMSPHIRRAHWHLYWTGPRTGTRTPVLRWLPPIAVGF